MMAYLMLSYIPIDLLKLFTWLFFMMLFLIGLIVVETPISFTQLYHLTILTVIQVLLAFDINTNPVYQFLLYQILFRRVRQAIYDSLSTESLLPYAVKDMKSKTSSSLNQPILYDFIRLVIPLCLFMPYRQYLTPMFLSHFSAPW